MFTQINLPLPTNTYMFLRPNRLDSRVFVLHGAAAVPPFQPRVGTVERQAIACFVAQRPYDDASVVLVPLDNASHPGQMSCLKGWPIGQGLVWLEANAMGLDVGLIDDVEALKDQTY